MVELIIGAVVVLLLSYFIYDRFLSNKGNDDGKINEYDRLPYKVIDSILTDAERSFYHALKLSVGERAIICPKVGLKDIFFISKGVGKDYMKYFGKISKKHVDFLLCEVGSMRPLCGIELDDISHTNKKTYERDLFVEKLYKDANFELIRMSAKSGYTNNEIEEALTGVFDKHTKSEIVENNNGTILCPKCNVPMALRRASKGQNAGKEFYGCPNYPKCKEVMQSTI